MKIKLIIQAAVLFLVLTVITGILYPFLVTGIAQILFSKQANGSLIYQNNMPVGSDLIGQAFDQPQYFWGRLSATSPTPFNAAASSGSNLGPLNPALLEAVTSRIQALQSSDPQNTHLIPVDLVTFSASGLDPHISLAAVDYQVPRVARMRGLSSDIIKVIVKQHTSGRFLGLIGEPVANVLKINAALDAYCQKGEKK
jgi:potassium-transporting ATPase KdpC subunit